MTVYTFELHPDRNMFGLSVDEIEVVANCEEDAHDLAALSASDRCLFVGALIEEATY